eukprot:6200661-Pleurochrysis_carterae.AAC.2
MYLPNVPARAHADVRLPFVSLSIRPPRTRGAALAGERARWQRWALRRPIAAARVDLIVQIGSRRPPRELRQGRSQWAAASRKGEQTAAGSHELRRSVSIASAPIGHDKDLSSC